MDKNDIKIKKSLMRKEFLKKRNSLSKIEVSEKSNIIIKKICDYIEKNDFKNIMIFMNMENEVEVTKLIKLYPNKNFYIPKTLKNREMKINLYNENELVLHKFGYYESKSENYYNESVLDLIIMPGVIFDINKNRIGFGGGYYDTFLEKLSFLLPSPLIIAVCYDFQLIDFIPTESFDLKPEIIITEKRVLKGSLSSVGVKKIEKFI